MPEVLFENEELCKKIRGIIQVGAHCGEEFNHIKKYNWNQLYFEPITESFYYLVGYVTTHGGLKQKCFFSGYALLDKAGYFTLYLGKDFGSSSFLKLNPDRPVEHQTNTCSGERVVEVTTLDLFFKENDKLIVDDYNLLYIDTQGTELHVLVGAKENLKNIDIICLEVSYYPIYLQSPTLDQISDYLSFYGFELLEHRPIPNNTLQGDAVFVKKGF